MLFWSQRRLNSKKFIHLQELHNEEVAESKELLSWFSYSLCISAVFSANIALKACREVIEVLTCQLVRSFVGTLLRWIRKFGENVDINWTKMKVSIFANLKSNGPVLWNIIKVRY